MTEFKGRTLIDVEHQASTDLQAAILGSFGMSLGLVTAPEPWLCHVLCTCYTRSGRVGDERIAETGTMVRDYVLIASMIGFGSLASADNHTTGATVVDEAVTGSVEQEVDLAAAAEIYQNSCRACHGNNAGGAASYPSLSDLEPDYIAEKLEIYRSGEKIGPNSILMIQPARQLSDEDIANLSVFVATAFD